ncbi:outer membrane lipoprotein carrier protein LolA [Gammaproteobacteria bacterium]|nr:outer membrane lipoprotein carrier protein LolA [Gammaproteobacteria bacterium]
MLNKLFLIFLISSFKVFACAELNYLDIYSQDTRTISLTYIQSYEGINKSNAEGQVYFEKPNLFKIETTKPTKTELIVNNQDVYRTDYDLNETIKYKLANIESQIPALLLLKSKKKVCSFLNNSESSKFVSDLNIISENGSLKIISYKDQFGADTQIDFINIKLNDELDKKIFDYNKETILVILN